MGSIAIGRPILDATFTYAYRNTGGSWSSEIPMTRGISPETQDDNFVAPVCDELRFTANLTNSEPLRAVHLCGLNIASGLTFEVLGAATLTTQAQTVYAFPEQTHRQTIYFSETTHNQFQLIVTGLNQRVFDMDYLMFADISWQPVQNFNNSSPLTLGQRFISMQTNASNSQKLDRSTTAETFNFTMMKDIEYRSLNHLIKMKTVGGMCLVIVDDESTDHQDSYIGLISISDIGRVKDINTLDLISMEKYKQ